MCGVAGVLNLNGAPADRDVVRRMTRTLVHRGPDGEGVYTRGPAGLGHRRLSVIDLTEAGDQPMATPDGRYVLSYNGEIYNYRELRPLLEARGWRFRSRCDTEVVLYALAEWGRDALRRFNGMFALALWDAVDQRLLLARDRFGVKPLYYGAAGPAVVFGSEVKALLAHPHLRAAMDGEALVEYFTFQNFFTSKTLFAGVSLLPAGTSLELVAGEPAVAEPRPYWDMAIEPDGPGVSDQEYLDELDRLFHQAVTRQLVSDVAGRVLPERRAGLGLHHGRGVPGARGDEDLHRRVRPDLDLGRRAQLRRAGGGRAHVLRLQDRALRDGAQGGRPGAGHAPADLAPRGAPGRPELPQLLRRRAGRRSSARSSWPAPAATSSSAATRGGTAGPWRTATSRTTSTSTTCSGSASSRTS